MILVAGGIDMPINWPKSMGLAEPHVTVPTLMLSGKYDFIYPVETHQKPLFYLIGTPPEDKKHVIFEAGHLPLPRAPMLKEIMAWLDKYQGPVNSKRKGGNETTSISSVEKKIHQNDISKNQKNGGN